jgi:hypothetical protein
MLRGMTPALDAVECPRPVTAAEVAAEVRYAPTLPEHLEEQLEIRAREPSLSGQTATQWVASRVFGGTEPKEPTLADDLSNVLSVGTLACQLLTDVTLQAHYGLPDGFWWQVMLVDSVAHGLAQGLAWIGRRLGERSEAEQLLACQDGDDPTCGYGIRPSGRATLGFTSAGLMCLHQQMAGDGDWGRCAGGLAMAATVGAVRALSDEHRFSDVLLSAGVGLFAGYLLPLVTFYGLGGRAPARRGRDHRGGVDAWVSPTFSSSGLGMQAQGVF